MTIPSSLTPEQVTQMVEDAYIYAYPLLVMYFTQQASTTVPIDPEQTPSDIAPLNVFSNMTSFPNADFTVVVRPNLDTLYSQAWLNLSTGPLVLKLPNSNARFYLMPILSAWTDVIASPGMRTNLTTPSTAAQDFLIVGPGWKGPLPPCFDSLHVIRIPTSMAWIIGRTKALNTSGDMAKVHELQAQYQLVPLADYLQDPTGNYHPDLVVPVNPTYPTVKPPDMVTGMSQGMAEPYFNLFARLLVHNPPLQGDGEMVANLELLGISPGQPLNWSGEPTDIQQAIAAGVQQGIQAIPAAQSQVGIEVNGWTYNTSGVGNFQPPGADHDNYLVRAYIALNGLGANLPQDAVYPLSVASPPLDGSTDYTLQFTTGTPSPPSVAKIPPVNPSAFWSLTAYDEDGYLIPNSANKYNINSGDPLYYENGLLTLYIQSAAPADQNLLPNWLPVAAGKPFTLTIRLYWPDQSVLSNAWAPPVIQGPTGGNVR